MKHPEYKIEKGIPLPKKITYMSGLTTTARKLKKGESFFCPLTMKQIHGSLRHARIDGVKFTARSVNGGVRVWRIK